MPSTGRWWPRDWPGCRHSAARLGPGSDVLGYDTARSTDHDWGARLAVLVDEDAPRPLEDVPAEFRGWPAEVVVAGIGPYLTGLLGFDPRAGISARDWLVTPQQTLASVTSGAVYHDGLGELEPVREALAWYPRDLWLWQLAGQWRRIAQEEPFCGRADEGSAAAVARSACEDVDEPRQAPSGDRTKCTWSEYRCNRSAHNRTLTNRQRDLPQPRQVGGGKYRMLVPRMTPMSTQRNTMSTARMSPSCRIHHVYFRLCNYGSGTALTQRLRSGRSSRGRSAAPGWSTTMG